MKKKHAKRARLGLYATMLWLTLGLFAILSFALTLPYNRLLNNVVLNESVLANVLLILMDLFEILAYAAGASLLLFAAFRPFSNATVLRLGLLYVITTVMHYVMELLGAWMLYGTRYFVYNIMEPTMINQIPYLLLDLGFVLIATVLATAFAEGYYQKRAILNKASILFQSEEKALPVSEDVYPFKKILSLKNPLQCCAFILGCVLAAANLISSLWFDLFTYLPNASSVEFTDVLSMIGSYVYCFLIGAVFYLVCILSFHQLFRYQDKFTK